MTRSRFFVLAAIVGFFAHGGVRAQTGINASQIVCPASSLPVAAVAIPVPATPGTAARTNIVCAILDPASFRVDLSGPVPRLIAVAGGSTDITVDGEALGGIIDGQNAVFSLTTAPNPASSLRVYRNGVRQQLGQDYTLSGSTLTFIHPPTGGDSLLADYRHQ